MQAQELGLIAGAALEGDSRDLALCVSDLLYALLLEALEEEIDLARGNGEEAEDLFALSFSWLWDGFAPSTYRTVPRSGTMGRMTFALELMELTTCSAI